MKGNKMKNRKIEIIRETLMNKLDNLKYYDSENKDLAMDKAFKDYTKELKKLNKEYETKAEVDIQED